MTNIRLARAFIEAVCAYDGNALKVKSWQEYEN